MASVRSHGGTPPASPRNGSTCSSPQHRGLAVRRGQRAQDPVERADVLAEVGGERARRPGVEPHARVRRPPRERPTPARSRGRLGGAVDVVADVRLRQRVGERLWAAARSPTRRRTRCCRAGRRGSSTSGRSSSTLKRPTSRDHDPGVGEERRGLRRVDDGGDRVVLLSCSSTISERSPSPTRAWTSADTAARRIDSSSPTRKWTAMAAVILAAVDGPDGPARAATTTAPPRPPPRRPRPRRRWLASAAAATATRSTQRTPTSTGTMTTAVQRRHGAGDQRRRQAVQHHEAGDRHGQRGWRGCRRAAADRKTSRLGSATPSWAPSVTPSGHARGPRPGAGARAARTEDRHPRRRADRQPEADRADEQRVDQQQPDHGDGEQAGRLPFAAEGEPGGAQARPSPRRAAPTARRG